MTNLEITTPRLLLTRLTAEDAPALFTYRSDPEVCRYQGFEPGSLADAEDFITTLLPHEFDSPGTWFQFGIRLRDSGGLIGDIGAHFLTEDPRQVEIGFTLAPAQQGKGYATEAVTGLLEHLFGAAGKHRVIASVDPRNTACTQLLERIGMRREAHFRESLWFKGEWADDVNYAILASEWTARST